MLKFESTPEFESLLTDIVSKEVKKVLQEITIRQEEAPIPAKELRERLNISMATELRYKKLGLLRPISFGRKIFYMWSEVMHTLQGQSIELLPPTLRKARKPHERKV